MVNLTHYASLHEKDVPPHTRVCGEIPDYALGTVMRKARGMRIDAKTLEAAQGNVLTVALAGDRVGGWLHLHGHGLGTGALPEIFARKKLRHFSTTGGGSRSGGLGQGTGVHPALPTLTQFFELMRAQGARARARAAA